MLGISTHWGLAGKQLYGEGPWGPGGHQADREAAVHCHSKEDQQHRGLHEGECCQQADGGSSLLSPDETMAGVLCPVLGSSV